MTVRDALIRNTFWYGCVTVLGLGTGFVMSIVLARGLGPSRMGDYSYVLWLSRTIDSLATLGFAFATTRYTASALAQDDPGLAWSCVRYLRKRQMIATTVVAALVLPPVIWFSPPSIRWSIVAIVLVMFPLTLEQIYSNSVYGAQRYDLTARVSTVKMTLQLAAAAGALALGLDIFGVVVATSAVVLVSCALQRRSARGLYRAAPTAIPAAMKAEMRAYLIPLSLVVVLDSLVWDRSEVFFLRLWASSQDIAFYSLAFGLSSKAMVLPEIAVGALLPAFSALHGSGATTEFARVYRTAIRSVALVGVPLATLSVALAPTMVRLLYGDAYTPVAALFCALIAVSVFGSARRVAWSALRGVGDRRGAVMATAVAAVVNVAAAACLTGPWGTWGAVVANTGAQVIATVWALAVMYRTYRCAMPAVDLAKICAAGLVALAVTVVVAGPSATLARAALASVAGLATYLATAIALGVIGVREWRVLITSTRRLATRPV